MLDFQRNLLHKGGIKFFFWEKVQKSYFLLLSSLILTKEFASTDSQQDFITQWGKAC